ncbi:hypothetical protein [Streptomyces sp. NPDC002467]|uniref:hypothetical protein n=1 Tax=Streptomyces sp. NPDC002467 TaxID=3364647 RepID=UPI0036BD72B4
MSFMAPERLSTLREVGPAADVFVLGAVLAYAATGRGPFDGHTGTPPIAIAVKIAQDAPDLAEVITERSASLAAVSDLWPLRSHCAILAALAVK